MSQFLLWQVEILCIFLLQEQFYAILEVSEKVSQVRQILTDIKKKSKPYK